MKKTSKGFCDIRVGDKGRYRQCGLPAIAWYGAPKHTKPVALCYEHGLKANKTRGWHLRVLIPQKSGKNPPLDRNREGTFWVKSKEFPTYASYRAHIAKTTASGGVILDRKHLSAKLHPSRFPGMSGKMAAIVNYILNRDGDIGSIAEMTVTSDGIVMARRRGDIGLNDFIGNVLDLERNWHNLRKVAGLTQQEDELADQLYHQRILHIQENAGGNPCKGGKHSKWGYIQKALKAGKAARGAWKSNPVGDAYEPTGSELRLIALRLDEYQTAIDKAFPGMKYEIVGNWWMEDKDGPADKNYFEPYLYIAPGSTGGLWYSDRITSAPSLSELFKTSPKQIVDMVKAKASEEAGRTYLGTRFGEHGEGMGEENPPAPRVRGVGDDTKKLVESGRMDAFLTAVGQRYKLTPREAQALLFCADDASANGFDFGITGSTVEKMKEVGLDEKVSGALLTNLAKKGAIILWKPLKVNDEMIQQYTFDSHTKGMLYKLYEDMFTSQNPPSNPLDSTSPGLAGRKNLMGKTRPVDKPYEIWKSHDGSWEWRVLKKWQADDSKPYARWFCWVKSPFTPMGEMGDVYAAEVMKQARKIFTSPTTSAKTETERVRAEDLDSSLIKKEILRAGVASGREEKPPEQAISYKVAVLESGDWISNALRFASKLEADLYGEDLLSRWTAVKEVRVTQTTDAPTHTFNNGWTAVIKRVEGNPPAGWMDRETI